MENKQASHMSGETGKHVLNMPKNRVTSWTLAADFPKQELMPWPGCVSTSHSHTYAHGVYRFLFKNTSLFGNGFLESKEGVFFTVPNISLSDHHMSRAWSQCVA